MTVQTDLEREGMMRRLLAWQEQVRAICDLAEKLEPSEEQYALVEKAAALKHSIETVVSGLTMIEVLEKHDPLIFTAPLLKEALQTKKG